MTPGCLNEGLEEKSPDVSWRVKGGRRDSLGAYWKEQCRTLQLYWEHHWGFLSRQEDVRFIRPCWAEPLHRACMNSELLSLLLNVVLCAFGQALLTQVSEWLKWALFSFVCLSSVHLVYPLLPRPHGHWAFIFPSRILVEDVLFKAFHLWAMVGPSLKLIIGLEADMVSNSLMKSFDRV